VVVEAIGLLLPIGTQLVTDHVIMAHDQSLLSVICIGLVFFTLFRTFISMLRAWISLTLNTLTNIQWKTTLFDHLASLPLSFLRSAIWAIFSLVSPRWILSAQPSPIALLPALSIRL
jgi:ABC-type bacteriocin/lantibiotic exporter with double-glycine peptidase domain